MNKSIGNDICAEDNLPIYIRYTELRVLDFGQLLISFDGLYEDAFGGYMDITGLSFTERPRFEICEIHTGDSIKFEFTEGWSPKVYSDDKHDIIIGAPKKIGIPLLVGFLLLSSVQKVLDVRNKHLDGRIKKLELRLKQAEISKLLSEKDSKRLLNLREKSDEITRKIAENKTFVNIKVYDVEIKHNRPDHEFENKLE